MPLNDYDIELVYFAQLIATFSINKLVSQLLEVPISYS